MYLDLLIRKNIETLDIVHDYNNKMEDKITIDDVEHRKIVLSRYKKRLHELLQITKISQRSSEWYEMREKMITASNFAQALNKAKFGTQTQFLRKKCLLDTSTLDPMCPPIKWGTMYEPVAISIYEQRNEVKLFEFGLLKHDEIEYFGASPDGITEDGIMLEIKCPFKRQINDEIPLQYYYQVQGQLDVCKLDECHFLECKFREYKCNNVEEMDTWLTMMPIHGERGIIIEFNDNDIPNYKYSPIVSDCKEQSEIQKLLDWFQENKTDTSTVHLWYLETFRIKTIYRDQNFLKENFDELDKIWQKINDYKSNDELMMKEIG